LEERREYLFLANVLDPARALRIAEGGDAIQSLPSQEDAARFCFGAPSDPGAPSGRPPISAWIWGLDAV
jgi:hypothetical protein